MPNPAAQNPDLLIPELIPRKNENWWPVVNSYGTG
jgi:hypothetical protein